MEETLLLTDPNEIRVIKQLRSLNPHENINIQADAQARPNSYLVTRTTKVMLIAFSEPQYVK